MNRSLPVPALTSVALHGALLLGLLHVRYDQPAETSAFNVVRVEWVRSGEGTAPDGVAEEGSSPPETADASAEAPEAEPAPSDVPPEPEQSPAPAAVAAETEPPPEPEPEPQRPAQQAPEAPRVATAEASLTPLAVESSPPASAATTPPPPDPAPQPETPPAPALELATLSLPSPAAPVEAAPIPERQRKMLDRRLERWARDLESLAQSEPSITWEHDGAEYTATFTAMPAADDMGIDEMRVEVRTARSGQSLTTEMRLQRLSFSHFAQFIDRWDPQVQIHDDEIDGRFHSNSEIYVANTGGVRPTFHGKVTTARDINTANSTGRIVRKDVFRGGLETRVGRIALPARFLPFETLPPADGEGVTVFARDTAIVFYADGSFGARPLDAPESDEQRRPLGEAPAYLLANEDVALEVSGVVNGKVLVYSPERIVVVGNLTYAADPRETESDDYLGLVSNGTVEIATPEVTGSGDLVLHGAVFAKRRFQVRSYRSRGRATLAVYGSITAGSLSATEPRYRTRLEFDPRLENARPPRFPVTARYELADWDGEWRVEPLAEPDGSLAVDSSPR